MDQPVPERASLTNLLTAIFAAVFVVYGMWLLYTACVSFATQLPVTGSLTLAGALIACSASFYTRKHRWRIVFVLMLLLYIIVDVSAVFLSAQQ